METKDKNKINDIKRASNVARSTIFMNEHPKCPYTIAKKKHSKPGCQSDLNEGDKHKWRLKWLAQYQNLWEKYQEVMEIKSTLEQAVAEQRFIIDRLKRKEKKSVAVVKQTVNQCVQVNWPKSSVVASAMNTPNKITDDTSVHNDQESQLEYSTAAANLATYTQRKFADDTMQEVAKRPVISECLTAAADLAIDTTSKCTDDSIVHNDQEGQLECSTEAADLATNSPKKFADDTMQEVAQLSVKSKRPVKSKCSVIPGCEVQVSNEIEFQNYFKDGKYICDKCGYTTIKKPRFRHHKNEHCVPEDKIPRSFACPMCSSMFTYDGLRLHLRQFIRGGHNPRPPHSSFTKEQHEMYLKMHKDSRKC